MIWCERAPAKVNLTLHVTGQRADGYHLLDSLVVFTDAGDRLEGRANAGRALEITGPEGAGLSAGADNLVLRAAKLMGASDFAFQLQKNLPVASGIGGGSADAAACLRLVARATGRPLPDTQALLSLGADVPVCVPSKPCRMQGIGEQITPVVKLPDFALLLVNPRVQVSTPEIFRKLACKANPAMAETLPDWHDRAEFIGWLSMQRNDLEAPACQVAPVIADILRSLRACDGCGLARMSGSGATCFGVFDSLAAAQQAAEGLRRDQPDWWIMPTEVLPA